MTGPELPDPRMFATADATRGAVFRGLLRTALLALALYLAALAVGDLLGRAAFRFHDRDHSHFNRVLVTGWIVGHPGVAAVNRTGSSSPDTGWRSATGVARFTQPDGRQAVVRIQQNLLGHVSVDGDVSSRLDAVLEEGRASHEQAETFVRGLPDSALTEVLLNFAAPLSEQAAAEFEESSHVTSQALFFDEPFRGARAGFSGGGGIYSTAASYRPVSWPTRGVLSYRGGFPDWTAQLSDRDSANMERLGLPSVDDLKKLGEAAQVHGLLLRDLTKQQLLALLADRRVATFTPVDVRFDILHKDQSR